jgi:hypothetical protein
VDAATHGCWRLNPKCKSNPIEIGLSSTTACESIRKTRQGYRTSGPCDQTDHDKIGDLVIFVKFGLLSNYFFPNPPVDLSDCIGYHRGDGLALDELVSDLRARHVRFCSAARVTSHRSGLSAFSALTASRIRIFIVSSRQSASATLSSVHFFHDAKAASTVTRLTRSISLIN